MTSQSHDRLWYNNVEYWIGSQPLYEYLDRKGIEFQWQESNNWKAYHCIWEIKGSCLFLVSLKAYTGINEEVDIQYLFPGKTEVFAEWFTGKIYFPQQFLHPFGGISSKYIKEFRLNFVNGIQTFYDLMEEK